MHVCTCVGVPAPYGTPCVTAAAVTFDRARTQSHRPARRPAAGAGAGRRIDKRFKECYRVGELLGKGGERWSWWCWCCAQRGWRVVASEGAQGRPCGGASARG